MQKSKRNLVQIEEDDEAKERERATRRLNAYQEMADIQLRMILESMMTLKKVDRSRASIIHDSSMNQTQTDVLLQQVFSETVMRQQLGSGLQQEVKHKSAHEELRSIAMANTKAQMYQSQRATGRLNPSLLGETGDSDDSEEEHLMYSTFSHSRA